MALRDDLKAAKEALVDPNLTVYVYNGIRYTREQLRDDLIPLLEKQVATQQSQKDVASAEVSRAEKDLQDALATQNRNLNAFAKNRATQADLDRDAARVKSAQATLDALRPAPAVQQVAPTPVVSRSPMPETVTGAAVAEEQAMRTEAFAGRVPTVRRGGGAGGAVTPVKVKKADVDAALAAQGIADTPENRKAVRAQLQEGKKKPVGWESLVEQQAGEYAYLLDPKFEGVGDLLRQAVNDRWFESEEGKAQFLQELKKTPYGQNTTTRQQTFDLKTPAEKQLAVQTQIDKIRSEYGDIQFDQAALEEVAGVAARNGSSDIELGRLVYRAAFKRGAAAPDYTTPVAARTALGGADADRIRAIYRAYGQRPDDAAIARILAQEADPASGTVMTEDMLRNNLRDIAKVSYAPFADLLDRGVSVETIFSPYQQIAARVLEKSSDQVALVDANGVPTQFASALMGEKPMSLTEWVTRLKADERFGWQFTTEAKQQATSLVMDLEKAFGFRA